MEVIHPLRQWLDDTGTRQTDFAKEIGCTDGYLSLLLQDRRGVSLKLAQKIETATGGIVTAEHLRCRPVQDVPTSASAEATP
jgi:DNA-binding transcriptional regulator YdaS (Cro superfamily)